MTVISLQIIITIITINLLSCTKSKYEKLKSKQIKKHNNGRAQRTRSEKERKKALAPPPRTLNLCLQVSHSPVTDNRWKSNNRSSNSSKKHTAKLKTGGGSGDGGNRLKVNGPCGQQQQQSKVNVSVTHRKRER